MAPWKRMFAEDNRLDEMHSMWQAERYTHPDWVFDRDDYFAYTNVPLDALRAWARLLNIRLPDYTIEDGPPDPDT